MPKKTKLFSSPLKRLKNMHICHHWLHHFVLFGIVQFWDDPLWPGSHGRGVDIYRYGRLPTTAGHCLRSHARSSAYHSSYVNKTTWQKGAGYRNNAFKHLKILKSNPIFKTSTDFAWCASPPPHTDSEWRTLNSGIEFKDFILGFRQST